MTVPVGPWRLTFSAEQLAELRHDKEFALLITMGRMINALRFGTTAMNALGKREEMARVGESAGSDVPSTPES